MRSDRYKKNEERSSMSAADREDFWMNVGNPNLDDIEKEQSRKARRSRYDVQAEQGLQTRSSKHDITHAEKPSKAESAGSFFVSLLVDIVIAFILAAAVLYFIRPTIVKQTSMEDTLHENDYMIMYKRAYKKADPERGDIIIFQSTLTDEESGKYKLLIKRVIGLPGDEIMISDGQLYINGEAYHEDYLKDGYTPAFEIPPEGETYTVPDGYYFCMGDNRVGSVDSRRSEIGCVARDTIKGKVILRLFPFNKIRRF